MLRAFSVFFQLVNLAEQVHRVRRRRQIEHEAPTAERVARRGVRRASREQACPRTRSPAAAPRSRLELVLTAHPTEATRRTVLLAHVRLAELLEALDSPTLTPSQRELVESPWPRRSPRSGRPTRCAPERPRVTDEIRHGLWFFEQTLLDEAEALLRAYRRAASTAPAPLRFGSWIGSDLDGNPIRGRGDDRAGRRAGALARARALRARGARRSRSPSGSPRRSWPSTDELRESIARDEQELGEYAGRIGAQNDSEPYRRKLSFVWWRLANDGYESAAAFAADLELVDRSLRARGVRPPRRRAARGPAAAARDLRLPARGARRASARA